MVYSDTTNKNGILQRCEDYTNIGDGNITGDATLLYKFASHTNEALYDIIREIIFAQDSFDWDDSNHTDYPIGTAALVASQRDYPLPSSLNFLTIKRLDVTYDGTNWYQAAPIDSSQMKFGLGNDSVVDGYFSKTQPRYDAKANGFWLYPMADATDVSNSAQFRIEFTREFDEFVYNDTSQEPGIDRPFHDLVAIGASLKYAVAKDAKKAASLKTLWDEGIANLRTYYGRRNSDDQIVFSPQIPSYS